MCHYTAQWDYAKNNSANFCIERLNLRAVELRYRRKSGHEELIEEFEIRKAGLNDEAKFRYRRKSGHEKLV